MDRWIQLCPTNLYRVSAAPRLWSSAASVAGEARGRVDPRGMKLGGNSQREQAALGTRRTYSTATAGQEQCTGGQGSGGPEGASLADGATAGDICDLGRVAHLTFPAHWSHLGSFTAGRGAPPEKHMGIRIFFFLCPFFH